MGEVVSFRADDEEVALIERARRHLGLATRAEAVRHLLRAGALATPRFSGSKLAAFRLPAKVRTGRSMTSAEIDAYLSDGEPR